MAAEARREAEAEAEAERIAGAFWERLVARRNRRMVERMLPGLRQGGVFVAVGALHLPGEEGLVALLRQEGFTVERVDEASRPEGLAGGRGGGDGG